MNKQPGWIAYDPCGQVTATPRAIAPRVSALEGKRLGILDNSKWNANKLLRAVSDELRSAHNFAATRMYCKESFSKTADEALLAQISKECDIVLTAIGD